MLVLLLLLLQRVATSHNVANNFEHDKRRISLLLKANKSKSSCTFQLIGATQRGQLQKAWPGLAERVRPPDYYAIVISNGFIIVVAVVVVRLGARLS